MKKIINCISTIEELNVDLYKELNLGVEIQDFTDPGLSHKDREDIFRAYLQKLKSFKNIIALHGPFIDLKPASPDPEIREISKNKYLHTLDIAHRLGVDYVIFHSQINPYLSHGLIREVNTSQARDFFRELARETSYNKKILIENIYEEDPSMLRELIEAINLENVRVILDIGHAKLGRVSLEKWFMELNDYIEYIHVHSNDGIIDSHNRISDGEIKNLYRLIGKYKIKPLLSLEYKVEDIKKEYIRY